MHKPCMGPCTCCVCVALITERAGRLAASAAAESEAEGGGISMGVFLPPVTALAHALLQRHAETDCMGRMACTRLNELHLRPTADAAQAAKAEEGGAGSPAPQYYMSGPSRLPAPAASAVPPCLSAEEHAALRALPIWTLDVSHTAAVLHLAMRPMQPVSACGVHLFLRTEPTLMEGADMCPMQPTAEQQPASPPPLTGCPAARDGPAATSLMALRQCSLVKPHELLAYCLAMARAGAATGVQGGVGGSPVPAVALDVLCMLWPRMMALCQPLLPPPPAAPTVPSLPSLPHGHHATAIKPELGAAG